MKKVLSIMLIILVVISSIPTTVFGAENQENNNMDEFTYTLSGDNAVITSYNGSDLFVDIPSEINGHTVSEISFATFKSDNKIVGIEVPNGITKIQQGTFKNCSNVEYISLPSTLKNININTLVSNNDCVYIVERNSDAEKFVTENDIKYKKRFASDEVSHSGKDDNISYRYNDITSSLYVYGESDIKNYSSDNQPWKDYRNSAKSIKIFDGITSIGSYAFYNFSNVTPEITINTTVEKIGNNAFEGCSSLKKVNIPNSIKSIGNSAFSSCNAVTEIELGAGLTQLGIDNRYYYNPFYSMTSVKKITFNSEKVPITPYADLFSSMDGLETVYVPAKSYNDYLERFSSYINNAKFVLLNNSDDFIIEDGVLKLYQGKDSNIVIPSNVTKIGSSAFRNNTTIKSVDFKSNVEIISDNAFMGCTNLKSVSLNNELTTIAASAFNGCTSLKDITIPNSVKTIGSYAFYKCTSLSNEVTIPSSVKSIGEYAFAEDNKITSVNIIGNFDGTTIGNFAFQNVSNATTLTLGNVTSIGASAFSNCESLTGKLTIPDTVTKLNDNAFKNCKNITELEISKNLETISYGAFSNCTSLKKLIIPNNIKKIEDSVFSSCSSVTEIELGSGLTQLGIDNRYYYYNPFNAMTSVKKITFNSEKVPTTPYTDLFLSMDGLETVYVPVSGYSDYVSRFSPYINNARLLMDSNDEFVVSDGVLLQYTGEDTNITIPSSVEEISESAFKNNKKITSVTIGENVTKIKKSAFSGCTSLSSVKLTDKITIIDEQTFSNCTSLKDITIPNSVETIGNYAFYKCTSLSNEVTIPSSVKSIGEYAFAEDNKITSVNIIGNSDGTTIGNFAFQNVSNATTLTLGNVTSIGKSAFLNCTSLTGKLTIPDTVTKLNDNAFKNCKNITELEISKNLETISYGAFSNCTSLNKLIIPNNIKKIEDSVFSSCSSVTEIELGSGLTQLGIDNRYYYYNPFNAMTSVKKITFNSEKVPTTPYTDLFLSMDGLETVYVPVSGYSDYVSRFSPYINNARILMISDSDFVIKDGVLLQYNGNDTEITIPNEVKEIGDSAFKNNTNIKKVAFSDNVITINKSAFNSCINLETIILSNSISTIGDYAFYGCTKLSGALKIPENTRSIGNYAFNNCTSLTSVEIASNNEEIKIGNYSFQNDTSIKSISLGNVTSIGNNAFESCTGINTKVQFNDSLKVINQYAFKNCSGITDDLEIPTSVINIAEGAFQNCSSITNVIIPDSIKKISSHTFNGCKSLESIEIPDSVTTIGNYAFNGCSSVETVTLGENLQTIGSYNNYYYNPFYGMTSVNEITFKGDTLPSASFNDIFYSMNRLQTVYVTLNAYKSFGYTYSAYINNARYKVFGNDDDFIINDKNELLLYQGNDTVVSLPENIENIEVSAFQNNNTVEKVIFNENLKTVSSYAFENCVNLNSFEVNKNLTSIGSRAFYGCTSLENVYLNSNLTSIGSSAFANCTSVAGDLNIPSSVTNIGNNAFDGDSSIVTLKIEGNKEGTSIGSYAFRNADGITTIDLGCVDTIGTYAFQNCSSLTGELVIPDSVTSLSEGAFQNCSNITSLTLSEKLTAISRNAFENCTSIKGEIRIPDLVTDIYDLAFHNCKNVESVLLGTSVRNIGTYNNCYYNPFNGMTYVKEFVFTGTNVPNCYFEDLFYSMNSLETIFVPSETKNDFVDKFDKYKNNAVFSTDTMKCGVRNFVASNIYSNTVKLTWSKHQNDSVTNYIVTKDGEQIATPKNNQFIDYNLTTNKNYEYVVYGVNDNGDKTKGTKLSVTPKSMDIIGISTPHSQNTVSVQDGTITVSAKNENNGTDLDGNLVSGKLYYFDGNEKVFVGKSNAIISNNIYFNFNIDVNDLVDGEYKVLFTYTDIDNVTVEKEGTICVNKCVPAKIENVVAIGDYNDIKISWSKSKEVDSNTYKIYRKSELDTDYSLLTTVKGRDTLSYSDTNVKKNRLYSYYVITENSFGIVSEKSDEAIAMRGIDDEKPIITSITPSNYSFIGNMQKITVVATDNLMLGSCNLYYSFDEENWILIDTTKKYPFTFTLNTKDLSDKEIFVKAVAYDVQGNESEPKIVKYKVDNVGPNKVTDFIASKILSSKVTLKWSQPNSDDLASYVLEEKIENGNFKVVKDNITDNGYVIESLAPNTTHIYRVAGIDKRGNIGEYSDLLEVTTSDDTTAPVVTSLSPSASRRNSTINFSATASDDYGIKYLEIQISTDLKIWNTLSKKEFTTVSKTATYSFNVDVDEFNDGSIYVRAVAMDFAGNVSDISEKAPFVEYMIDKTAPNSPKDLVACSTDNSIYLTWVQGSEEDLSTYSVYRSTEENTGFIQLASGLKQINYYDTTAKRGIVYYYKIAVTDTVGNVSKFSSTVSAELAKDTKAPEVISITPNNNSSISKQFHTVNALVKDNYSVDTVVFEYKLDNDVAYRIFDSVKNVDADYKTVSADIPLNGLNDNSKVYVRVYCTDVSGLKSEYSSIYTYTYDDLAPFINNLTATIKKNTVTLNWSDNKDSDLSGFKVYRIDEKGKEAYLGSRQVSSEHSYEFCDSITSKTDVKYTYKVEAYDESGNYSSTLSNQVNYSVIGDKENNEKPVAKINGNEVMEKGVEEYFDGYSSTDDDSIV